MPAPLPVPTEWYKRGRGFDKQLTEEQLASIGDAILEARPDPGNSPRNVQWKVLKYRYGYSKTVLWALWKEAKARAERLTPRAEQRTQRGLKPFGD